MEIPRVLQWAFRGSSVGDAFRFSQFPVLLAHILLSAYTVRSSLASTSLPLAFWSSNSDSNGTRRWILIRICGVVLLGIGNRQAYRMLQTLQVLLCGHSLAGNVKRILSSSWTGSRTGNLSRSRKLRRFKTRAVAVSMSRLELIADSLVSLQFNPAAGLMKWKYRVVPNATYNLCRCKGSFACSQWRCRAYSDSVGITSICVPFPIALRVGAS